MSQLPMTPKTRQPRRSRRRLVSLVLVCVSTLGTLVIAAANTQSAFAVDCTVVPLDPTCTGGSNPGDSSSGSQPKTVPIDAYNGSDQTSWFDITQGGTVSGNHRINYGIHSSNWGTTLQGATLTVEATIGGGHGVVSDTATVSATAIRCSADLYSFGVGYTMIVTCV